MNETVVVDLIQSQGLPISVLAGVAYFFYKEHLNVKDYFLNENKELKAEIKEIKDNYEVFIKQSLHEQAEIIRQNTEVLNDVREIFLKLKK